MRKLTSMCLLASLLTVPALVQAEDSGLVGEVTFTSDYRFRGISRSEGRAAVQGRFDYQSDAGYYAGVRGSSIARAGNVELDYRAGYRLSGEQGPTLDVGLRYFNYPGQSSSDTLEVQAGLHWSEFALEAARSDDYFGSDVSVNHYRARHVSEWVPNLQFELSLGHVDADEALFGSKDRYSYYGAALTAQAMNLDVRLGWIRNNLRRQHCGSSTDCDTTFTLSISRSL